MRTRLIFAALILTICTSAVAQKLYRHVDEKGNVTFSDRPKQAGQKAEKPKTANVMSPEARRQLEYGEYARQREEQAERTAQQQRHYAQRRREIEAEQERRVKEADPYSPPQDAYRP